ncbi:uncharacterized protein LY79DRAFT_559570 [Colletotrichum navitas]|uniref:Uncharacterized protein n=1 Tax=Colletotrichum navitas TaxID=681940 RepID=A0AAD8PVV7_9PEZI|nr:uncharacterized protein LY79DRAFT_559570 [Colletotrichum navitas]KAK1585030.1 hypothetical protein LY79DRAFT_559570 [Colletotrichum navitas]
MDKTYVFEFNSKAITAHGGPISLPPDLTFQNVLRLSLDGNSSVNLPRRIVLKKELTDNPDLFDNELRVYRHLQSLQGTVIPECLGLAKIDGVRALLLSDIGGVSMLDSGMPRLEQATLEHKLAFPVRLIRQSGVHLGDFKMGNVHWCGDAFCVLDFEHAEILPVNSKFEEADVQKQVQYVSEPFLMRQEASAKMTRLIQRKRLSHRKDQRQRGLKFKASSSV